MPGPFYHIKTSVIDRGGKGSQIKRTHFAHAFFTLNQEWVPCSLCECSKLQHLGQKLQDKASSSFFQWGTFPPSVDTDVIHMIK